MSKIQSLPNNSNNYYRKAFNALNKNQYQEGLDLLIKSYQLQQNPKTLEDIVYTCIQLNQIDDLKSIWTEYFQDKKVLYQDPGLLQLWLTSVQYMYSIQDAINLLSQTILEMNQLAIIHQDPVHKLLDKLLKQQSALNLLQSKDSKTLIDFIRKTHQKNPYQILSLLKLSYQRQINTTFYQVLLKEAAIENYTKADLLHFLMHQGIDASLELSWFNESRIINPKSLVSYDEEIAYQNNLSSIQFYFSKQDPHLLKESEQLFTLHYLSFYPFSELVLPDNDTWIHYFRKLYLMEDQLSSETNREKYFILAQADINKLFQI